MAYERDKRGWSNGELASQMTRVGCAIDQSAIYKIEKGRPKRRSISVDELAAMSIVFETPADELMKPPEQALGQRARELVAQLHKDRLEALKAVRRINATIRELLTLTEGRRITTHDLDVAESAENAMLDLTDLALEIADELEPQPPDSSGGA
jgi:transcriptional regulator with XRE-family HTH domain